MTGRSQVLDPELHRPLPAPSWLSPTDLVREGLSGVRGRPLRTLLSALGIAVGIAAMVAVVGIGDASRAGLIASIRQLGTNLLTVQPGQTVFGQNAELPDTAVAMVGRISQVERVSAVGLLSGVTIRRTDRIPIADTEGIGVDATRLDLLPTLDGSLAAGIGLNPANQQFPVVVLGAVAARRLGIDRIGTPVYVAGRWLTVIGILRPMPLAPEIERAALVGWPYAQSSLGFDGHPTTIYERSADDAVPRVAALLPLTVDPQHPEQIRVSRPSDALTAELAARTTFSGLLLGLGLVALLVGGIGVANTMVISVLERRQEIGLRRALGSSRAQVRLQFLTEASAIALLGGMAGAAAGALVSLAYADSRHWPLVLPEQALAGAVAASVLVGVIAGAYPARRAARLTPTEALATG